MLDPERAHEVTLRTIAALPLPAPVPDDPRLCTTALGLVFTNPIGLAAGFDKDGVVAHKAPALGFGFAEVGTLTPIAQGGNEKPRVFRLSDEQAVINRYGFNNEGHEAALARLTRRRPPILGINIGANKESPDRVADYAAGVRALASIASYFTINISSPNTPGLRSLQHAGAFAELLDRVIEARNAAAPGRPLLVKIAPDLTLAELDDVVATARSRAIDGMIVSNTTLSRPTTAAQHKHVGESGGLSGRPLFSLSTRMLAHTYQRAEGAFPLIGVGGIDSADRAIAKIAAGATLIQIYTGLVFKGPGLVSDIKQGLAAKLDAGGLASLVGRDACDYAKD